MLEVVMAEGQGGSVDTGNRQEGALYRSEHARGGMTRRRFFKKTATRGAALVGAAAVAANGIRPPEGGDEYLAGDGPVEMVLSNHSFNSEALYTSFQATGDLGESAWPDRHLGMLDIRMREAKARGSSYLCFIDGFQRAGESKEGAWLAMPHPDLSQQDQYPEDIYACSADLPVRRGYGLDEMTRRQEVSASVDKLSAEMKQWYGFGQAGFFDGIKANGSNIGIGIAEIAIGTALIQAGIPDMKRRRVLAAALATGAFVSLEAAKRSIFAYGGIGILSGQESQKFATVLANTLNSGSDSELMESVKARTAMAFEAADFAASDPQFQPNGQPPIEDMIYGTSHGTDLPRIKTDGGHRLNLIADFMQSLLMRVDTRIIESYPELQEDRDRILATVLRSMTTYSFFKVNMPWGQTSIPSDQMATFQNEVLDSGTSVAVPVLQRLSDKVLEEFGISSTQ